MAYGKKREEHAFIRIGADIKKGNIKNVVLLCGVEQFLVKWAQDLLIKKYVNEATAALDLTVIDDAADTSKIEEACETMPMLSEKRVVVLSDFHYVWGTKSRDFDEQDIKELSGYIGDVPPSTLLIITAPEDPVKYRRSDPPLIAAIRGAGAVYDFGPLEESQLRSYIIKRFSAAGKTADGRVINALIWESGYFNREIDYALFNLENDIKKMIAVSAGDEITMEDAADSISSNLEHNIFKMIDAVSQSRKQEAFRLLKDLFMSGANVYQILATLCSQLELMLEVKEMQGVGMNMKDIKKASGVSSEYRIKKAAGYADKFSEDDLKRILVSAFEIDDQIKSGSLADDLAMEMFIAQV